MGLDICNSYVLSFCTGKVDSSVGTFGKCTFRNGRG